MARFLAFAAIALHAVAASSAQPHTASTEQDSFEVTLWPTSDVPGTFPFPRPCGPWICCPSPWDPVPAWVICPQ